jgi:hypothetical protein
MAILIVAVFPSRLSRYRPMPGIALGIQHGLENHAGKGVEIVGGPAR